MTSRLCVAPSQARGKPFVYCPPSDAPVVVFADADVVVASKPSGLLSVPGRSEAARDSALTRLEAHWGALGVVHRLDMDTSGLLVFARNKFALRALHRQFSVRSVDKRYTAWVLGWPKASSGLVDLPLVCDWPNRPLQRVDWTYGKPSQTRWQCAAGVHDNAHGAVLTLTPLSGRSHQLRVHLAALGHPILGDRFYGQPSGATARASRLMLHAHALGFTHPRTGERLCLRDELASEHWLEQRHLIV